MKKKYFVPLVSVLLLVSFSLFIISCSSSDDKKDSGSITDIFGIGDIEDLDPSKWDFYLGVMHDEDWDDYGRDMGYYITVVQINPQAATGNLTVKVDGNTVQMENWGFYWFGPADLQEGQTYNFSLDTGNKQYSASLQIPYNITSATFPSTFQVDQSHTVSWTLANNNKNQIAEAWSYYWDWDEDQESHYYKELKPSDRQFTFPANCVEDFGPETEYDLGILQIDYKMANKLVAVAMTGAFEYYWDDDWSREVTIQKTMNRRLIRIADFLNR